jgi:hypothetical protein
LIERAKPPSSLKLAQRISEATPRSPAWFPAEDSLLRKLAPELLYNWRLIADAFNFFYHSNQMEQRTASQCYVRYEFCFGSQINPLEGDSSIDTVDGDAFMKYAAARSNSAAAASRKPKVIEEFVPTANLNDDDPKFMRHKFIHRAIKRVMKKREEDSKARGMSHAPSSIAVS